MNGSVDIPRCNILPIQNNFKWSASSRTARSNGDNTNENAHTDRNISGQGQIFPNADGHADKAAHCILVLDLRNVWPQPLSIELQARSSAMTESSDADDWDNAYTAQETLQPGQVTRVILLIPCLFIAEPFAPIPSLETKKQFVLSASKLSAEEEAASRESFWYREELLKHLRGWWKEDNGTRQGDIDLRKESDSAQE